METALPVTEQLARQLEIKGLLASYEHISQQCFFSSKISQEQAQLMSVLFGKNVSLQQLPAL
jgi:hypothetical protein